MITFIGTGPMGQAMVRALVKAGHEVTVWNRTPSKAEGLGATVAPTVADALAASDVVFLSLTDYQVMFDLLDGQAVDGKVIDQPQLGHTGDHAAGRAVGSATGRDADRRGSDGARGARRHGLFVCLLQRSGSRCAAI